MTSQKTKHKATVRRRAGARTKLIMALGVLAAAAVAVVASVGSSKPGSPEGSVPESGAQTWRVERGPMTISLLAPGQTKAKNTTQITCQVTGEVKIVWLIPEGTHVEKGQKLIELEASGLEENLVKQKIDVADERADYEEAEQNLEIQIRQNKSDLLTAENKQFLAKLDLEKYTDGEYPRKILELNEEIKLAEDELERAQLRLESTERLAEKGYVSAGEVKADELNKRRKELEVKKTKKELEVLEDYEKRRETSSLENDVREADDELERTRLENVNELRNKEIEVETSKAKLDLEETRLARLEEEMRNTTITAPRDGMVVYFKQRGRRSSGEAIEEGSQVRFRQRLIDLPDFSRWQVETRVHESVIEKVKMGQGALIGIEALPDETVAAAVSKIGVLPDSGRWYMPDTKEYMVDLDVTTNTLPLKPGMTAKVEILIAQLEDVLYVPLQAVSNVDGQPIVMREGELGPEARVVEIGQNNDRFVEIRAGLREGDFILLEPGALAAPGSIIERPSDHTPAKAAKVRPSKDSSAAKKAEAETGTGETHG